MELKGKKMLFLGDSITAGAGTSDLSHVYWRVLGERTGAEVHGYGIGGTRIARQLVATNERYDRDFGSRVEEMEPQADVVVVFGGTNDYGHGDAPLGTMGDREDNTFYGALHCLCRKLISRYPEAVIVFITPLHRLNENQVLNELGIRNQAPLDTYAEIVREVTAYYGLPLCDLRRISGIQPELEEQRLAFMPDGLHPNDAGNARLAERLTAFLRAL